ncbi:hypothetical protein UVI_02025320 [Ustilaginoidea virens]|uniref:Uncharacterized protein n=1 Tax=Ustilaginoidea virens TaxID=1159556 RepID=A0A1B5KR39_USTVR|nr:hypothetical protein UVI_02025320 [Ustilaginoidea virens]
MSINSPEGYPLEDFSADAIRAGIAEAQKVANGSGSEQDIAEAKIELELPKDHGSLKDGAVDRIGKPFSDEAAKTREVTTTPLFGPTADPETPNRGPVTGNPFFLADRFAKATWSAPQTKKTTGGRGQRARRLSDCVPGRHLADRPPDAVATVDDWKRSRHTEGHILCCAASRGQAIAADIPSLDATVQRKIDRLHRHTEDLRNYPRASGLSPTSREGWIPWSPKSDAEPRAATAAPNGTIHLETPTKPPRTVRLHSPGDGVNKPSSKVAIIYGAGAQDAKDAVESALRPAPLFDLGPNPKDHHHEASLSPSSGEAGSDGSMSDVGDVREEASKFGPSLTNVETNGNVEKRGSGNTTPRSHGDVGTGKCSTSGLLSPQISSPFISPSQTASEPSQACATAPEHDVGVDLPSMTGYKRHRQDTYVCAKPKTPNSGPEPWPTLRKVERPVEEKKPPPTTPVSLPWARQALRQVSSNCSTSSGKKKKDQGNLGDDVTLPASRLIPVGTPVLEWRGNLSKTHNVAPKPLNRNNLCESCNPTDSKEPATGVGSCERCSHGSNSPMRIGSGNPDDEDPFTEPKLSVRAIENSLAWDKAQGGPGGRGVGSDGSEPKSASRSRGSNEQEGRKEKTTAEPARCCGWKERYLRLRDDVVRGKDTLRRDEEGSKAGAVQELGIEGMTIIVHMRHTDDLVINTDLHG